MYTKAVIVLVFMLLDIVTGLAHAFSTGTYNSSKMRLGLWHKLTEILAVCFCGFCDYALPVIDIALPVKLYACIIAYLCIMECGSIIENLGCMFPELGSYLGNVFEKVNKNEK